MTARHEVPESVHMAERRADELRIVREALATCEHVEINVHRSAGSTFDDHETIWGQCRACQEWVISVLHFGGGGHIETRVATDAERGRMQSYEDRVRDS